MLDDLDEDMDKTQSGLDRINKQMKQLLQDNSEFLLIVRPGVTQDGFRAAHFRLLFS